MLKEYKDSIKRENRMLETITHLCELSEDASNKDRAVYEQVIQLLNLKMTVLVGETDGLEFDGLYGSEKMNKIIASGMVEIRVEEEDEDDDEEYGGAF